MIKCLRYLDFWDQLFGNSAGCAGGNIQLTDFYNVPGDVQLSTVVGLVSGDTVLPLFGEIRNAIYKSSAFYHSITG